jgi:hypothetical protein
MHAIDQPVKEAQPWQHCSRIKRKESGFVTIQKCKSPWCLSIRTFPLGSRKKEHTETMARTALQIVADVKSVLKNTSKCLKQQWAKTRKGCAPQRLDNIVCILHHHVPSSVIMHVYGWIVCNCMSKRRFSSLMVVSRSEVLLFLDKAKTKAWQVWSFFSTEFSSILRRNKSRWLF